MALSGISDFVWEWRSHMLRTTLRVLRVAILMGIDEWQNWFNLPPCGRKVHLRHLPIWDSSYWVNMVMFRQEDFESACPLTQMKFVNIGAFVVLSMGTFRGVRLERITNENKIKAAMQRKLGNMESKQLLNYSMFCLINKVSK